MGHHSEAFLLRIFHKTGGEGFCTMGGEQPAVFRID